MPEEPGATPQPAPQVQPQPTQPTPQVPQQPQPTQSPPQVPQQPPQSPPQPALAPQLPPQQTPYQPLPPLQPPPFQPPPQLPTGPTPMLPPGPMPQPGQTLPQVPPVLPVPPGYPGGYATPLLNLPGQPMGPGGWPPPPTKRRLPRWLLIGIPLLIVALAAGTYGVIRLTSSPNPAVTKVRCLPQKLASCLVAAPGAASRDASAWGKSVSETGDAYASQFTDSAETQQPEVGSMVTGDGVETIVHRGWSFGSDQVDLILLQFRTIQGAKAWASDRSGEFLSTDGGQQLSVPGDSSAKASSSASANSSGDYVAHYITTVGNIDLEVHYASQGSLQQQNFQQWAGTEYASLQTAAAPAPDPAPTPTTFQTATCPAPTLTNCLVSMPAGSVVLTGLPTSYTDNSWAASVYSGANLSSVEQTLKGDEVTSIIAEAWATDGYAKASQVVLLQTRTDTQAQSLLTSLGGADSSFPDSFSVPGYPQAEGSYTTTAPDGSGIVDGWVDAQVGTIFLSMWFGFSATFDTATAQSWAATELNLLTQRTQSHWGFPIPTVSAPALTPFAADPCTAAALGGCLMSRPAGAAASGGSGPQDPGVTGFVGKLYPAKSDYEATWLTDDGASDAVSETWTASDGATATDYLLRFGSSRQAQAAVLQEYGDALVGAQSCTVTSLPATYCVVLPENDSTGAVTLRVLGWGSKSAFDLEVTKTDSADTADALKWAQTQEELLGG